MPKAREIQFPPGTLSAQALGDRRLAYVTGPAGHWPGESEGWAGQRALIHEIRKKKFAMSKQSESADNPKGGGVQSIDPEVVGKHFDAPEAEARWDAEWQKSGVYRWDSQRSRDETYVVDTPPPTASGSLHIGHVFSYTQADVMVRFKRMCGMNIFYPMGWDDNGLPTERRVQNYYHVRCDPNTP